jgi:hypothetical protein
LLETAPSEFTHGDSQASIADHSISFITEEYAQIRRTTDNQLAQDALAKLSEE